MRWTFDRIHDSFQGLKDLLEDLRGWFNQLAWDYRNNWLLHDITGLLNDLLYNPLWDLRLRVHDLRERFDDVGDFLVDLDIGDVFTEFIEDLTWSWSYFVDDPWGFIKSQAFKLDPTIYYWLDDPLQEIRLWIIKEVPNGRQLLDGPGEWVHWQLGGWWDGWYPLYHDPWGFIKNEAFKIDPTIYYWLDDPEQELRLVEIKIKGELKEWIEDNLLETIQHVIENNW